MARDPMIRFENTTTIRRPIEPVFAYLAEPVGRGTEYRQHRLTNTMELEPRRRAGPSPAWLLPGSRTPSPRISPS